MGYTETQNTPQEEAVNATAVETEAAAEAKVEVELTARDRCDHGGCNAQAYVMTKHGEGEFHLLWCGHHFAKHEVTLVGNIVKDNREMLRNDNRGAGAEAH